MLVALTVDVEDPDQRDHGSPDQVLSMVEAMGAAGIRATFFLQGRWVDANPEAAASIGAAGHLVGNHSYFHADTRLLTSEGVRADVTRGQTAIEAALGVDARPWYRLPYGAGAESPRIKRQLGALGYRHVGWDVDVHDYAMTSAEALVAALEHAMAERERAGATHAIVLLHSWPPATVGAMTGLCRFLLEGCEGTVTVDEVPGNGAVPTTSPLVGRARGLARRTLATRPSQA
jgi:peptidoglycan/xylan/chitin deacetylase (PgdA/CDA1 family)